MGTDTRAATPFDLTVLPELEDLLRMFARAVKLGIHTAVPASVIAYDPAQNVATLRVEIQAVVKVDDPANPPARTMVLRGTPPNMEAVLQPFQLVGVPVFVYGSQTNYISVPLVPGDTGLIHVCERSIETWMQQGIPSDPVFAFTHALKDGVFYPGARPKTKPLALPVDLTATVIQGTQIKLGRLAALAAARATDPVSPHAAMTAWALVVETAINTLAPGTFTGANSFAGTVQAFFATIQSGSTITKVA